jgi:hypothetical protein
MADMRLAVGIGNGGGDVIAVGGHGRIFPAII